MKARGVVLLIIAGLLAAVAPCAVPGAVRAQLSLSTSAGEVEAPPPGETEMEEAAPAAPGEAASSRAGAPEAPAAAAPAEESSGNAPEGAFQYNAEGKRDPFKTLLTLQEKQRDVSQLPPVQRFDLEQVKIIGIVEGGEGEAKAMIKAPDGRTYMIGPGMIIGKNEGEVVEVTLDGIRVMEKFVDYMNKETKKETFIKARQR